MTRYVVCWLLLFTPALLSAQPGSYLLQHEIIGPDQGLADRNIQHIFQDSLGYVWVKTFQGLYRYDGYRVTDYRDLPGDRRMKPETNFLEDRLRNRTYLFSAREIFQFDPIHLKINRIKAYEDPFTIKQINLSDDKFIVSFSGGLIHVLDKQFNKNIEINLGSDYDFQTGCIYNINDKVLAVKDLENLWVTYDRQSKKIKDWDENALIGLPLWKYLEEKNSYVAMGSFMKEVNGIDTKIETYLRDDKIYAVQSHSRPDLIGFFPLNTTDSVFVAPQHLRINKSQHSVDFMGQLTASYGSNIRINSVFKTRDNTFFVHTDYSLIKLSFIPNYFRKLLVDESANEVQTGISMRGMAEDSQGRIWFGSYENPKRGSELFHVFDPRTESVNGYRISGISGSVYRIRNTGSGRSMLFLYELGPMHEIRANSPEDVTGKVSAFYNQVMYDFHLWPDSTLWVCHNKGLFVTSLESYTRDEWRIETDPVLGNIRVNCIVPKDSQTVYLATSNGIYLMNRHKQILAHYYQGPDADIVIPGGLIYHVNPIGNILWTASSEGLIKITLNEKKATVYREGDGLPDHNIYCVLDDAQGNLWMSTNNGLCRLNPATGNVRNFNIEDGVPFREFNNASYLKASDGTLYFGGLNGVVSVVPGQVADDINENTRAQAEFLIFRRNNSIQTDTIAGADLSEHIRFGAGTSNIDLQMMIPAYGRKNQMRYRLSGELVTDWESVNDDNLIRFNYLPPGDYFLEIQSFIGGAGWSDESVSLHFNIAKFWYNTWWFFIGMILLTAIVIYLIYRYRLGQVKKIMEIRNRISADMHDEIGSTLSSISFYAQALLLKSQIPKEKEILSTIQDNSQKVQETLGDIIWSVHPEMDELEQVIRRMREFGIEMADSKQMVFSMDVSGSYNQIRFKMEDRRNFYLIFKEAVNNAVKYSEGKHIKVLLEVREQGQIILTIRDDGRGFDVNQADNGNGLNNMRRRAAELKAALIIKSEPGKGSEIQLIVN